MAFSSFALFTAKSTASSDLVCDERTRSTFFISIPHAYERPPEGRYQVEDGPCDHAHDDAALGHVADGHVIRRDRYGVGRCGHREHEGEARRDRYGEGDQGRVHRKALCKAYAHWQQNRYNGRVAHGLGHQYRKQRKYCEDGPRASGPLAHALAHYPFGGAALIKRGAEYYSAAVHEYYTPIDVFLYIFPADEPEDKEHHHGRKGYRGKAQLPAHEHPCRYRERQHETDRVLRKAHLAEAFDPFSDYLVGAFDTGYVYGIEPRKEEIADKEHYYHQRHDGHRVLEKAYGIAGRLLQYAYGERHPRPSEEGGDSAYDAAPGQGEEYELAVVRAAGLEPQCL